jgi:large subunit ribosomal protein L4
LSDRARNERVHVVSGLVGGETPSTKGAAEALAKVSTGRLVLLVVEVTDTVTWLSARNLTNVHILEPGQLNTYDVLLSDDVVFTKGALDAFLAGPAKGKSAKGSASSAEVEEADEVAEAPAVSTEKTAVSTEKTAVSTEKPVSTEKKPAKKAAAKKAAPKADAEAESADEPSTEDHAESSAAAEGDA